MPRSVITFALLVALVGCRDGEQEEPTAPAPIPVEVRAAAPETLVEHRLLSGDVLPWEVLPLSFKVGGRVSRLLVEEGDRVKKGQLVAMLDPRDYRLTSRLATVQVDALAPHLERAEKLRGEEALPQAQLDEIRSKMDVAKIQRSQAKLQLSYARLRSPIAGVVIQRRVAVGDLVDPSRPVAVVAVLSRVKVVLPVTQRDLSLFHEGDRIPISATGLEGSYVGVVHRIGYTADEKTRTFPIVLEVPNPDLELRAGMVVETRVEVRQHEGIFVPLDAVTRDAGGQPVVQVLDTTGRAVDLRPVRLGKLIGDRVRVEAGLAPGDKVVIRGLIQPGSQVIEAKALAATAEEPTR